MRLIDDNQFLEQASAAAQRGKLLRLVDPENSPGYRLQGDALANAALIKNPFFAQRPSRQLYLQVCDCRGVKQLQQELQRHRKAYPESMLQPVGFCGWLISQRPVRSIVTYLERQHTQKLDAGKPAFLRFYDSRVLKQLSRILRLNQLSALLGPIDHWFYIDSEKQLREISPHGEKRQLGGLRLSGEQWQAISRIEQVNRCLEYYRTLPQELRQRTVTDTEVDALLQVAKGFGLMDSTDITGFVLHGLVIQPEFYRHPLISSLLTQVDTQQSYIALTNRLSEDQWTEVSREMEVS